MLPLDTVNSQGVFSLASAAWFSRALSLLSASGVTGVAADVWWGAVERTPGQYTWTGYRQLLDMVKQAGLKMQVVMSFHACGGNCGDTATISLPPWVLQVGDNDPDLFFTHRPRADGLTKRNREYISIWASDERILCGRSAYECYADFMKAFYQAFEQDLGTTIEEVVIGAGPCGELRYPSYPECHGWRFPGIGEFQCYDWRALASLAAAAREVGHPEWGYGGPHDAGHYNSVPEETGFFSLAGSWDTQYGRFFLGWYSTCLLRHGERLLEMAATTFGTSVGVSSRAMSPDLPAGSLLASASSAGSTATTLSNMKTGSGVALPESQQVVARPLRTLVPLSDSALAPRTGLHGAAAVIVAGSGAPHLVLHPPYMDASLAPVGEDGVSQQQPFQVHQGVLSEPDGGMQGSLLQGSVPVSMQISQALTCGSATPTSTCTAAMSQDANLTSSSSGSFLGEPLPQLGSTGLGQAGGGGSGGKPENVLQPLGGVQGPALPVPGLLTISGVAMDLQGPPTPVVPHEVSPQGVTSAERSVPGVLRPNGDLHAVTSRAGSATSGGERVAGAGPGPPLSLGLSVMTHGLGSGASFGTLHNGTAGSCGALGVLTQPTPSPHAGSVNGDASRPHISMCGAPSMTLVASTGSASALGGPLPSPVTSRPPSSSPLAPQVPELPLGSVSLPGGWGRLSTGVTGPAVAPGPIKPPSSPHMLRFMSCSSIPSATSVCMSAPPPPGALSSRAEGVAMGYARSHPPSIDGALLPVQEGQRAPATAPCTPFPFSHAGLHAHARGRDAGAASVVGAAPAAGPSSLVPSPLSSSHLRKSGAGGLSLSSSGESMASTQALSELDDGGSGAQRVSMDDSTASARSEPAVRAAAGVAAGVLVANSAAAGERSAVATGGGASGRPGVVTLSLKIPGVHWWFKSRSHAAELTAGYYNTATHDGYGALVALCARKGAALTLTCVEMCDAQHPASAACSPEGLLKQLRALTARHGVMLSGENALPIFLGHGVDSVALDRVVINTRAWYGPSARAEAAAQHSYLMALQASQEAAMREALDRGAPLSHHPSLPRCAAAGGTAGVCGPQLAAPGYAVGLHGSQPPNWQVAATSRAGAAYGWGMPGHSFHHSATVGGYASGPVRAVPASTGGGSVYEDSDGHPHASSHHTHPVHPHHGHHAGDMHHGGYHHSITFGGGSPAHAASEARLRAGPVSVSPPGKGSQLPGAGSGDMCAHAGAGRACSDSALPTAGCSGGTDTQHRAAADLVAAGVSSCSLQPSSRRPSSLSGSGGGGSSGGVCLGFPGQQQGVAACGLRTDSYADITEPLQAMRSFTFLRLGPELLLPGYQAPWLRFMACMQQGGYEAGW